MKYYIGYFNKPWDESEFTVICATPNRDAADFILKRYKDSAADTGITSPDTYVMLTAAETMDLKLIF